MGNSTSKTRKTKAASGADKQKLTIGLSVFFALVIVAVIIALVLTLGGGSDGDGTCDPKCGSGTHCVNTKCVPDSSGPSDGSCSDYSGCGSPCTDTSNALCCGKAGLCPIADCCVTADGNCRTGSGDSNSDLYGGGQCFTFTKTGGSAQCTDSTYEDFQRITDATVCEAAANWDGKDFKADFGDDKNVPYGCFRDENNNLKFNTCCQVGSAGKDLAHCYDGSLAVPSDPSICYNKCGPSDNDGDGKNRKCECSHSV